MSSLTGTVTTEYNQVLNLDATEVIGSAYHVSLGPKWGRAELITGQGTRIVHCNDLLFGALLSVHSCVSLNPNSIGENNGKLYGAGTNWSLRFGNTCGCASKLNTFLVDPECTPAVTRLPGLHAVRQSYNPYSFEFQDCAPSTDPVMLADAAETRQLIEDNRVLSNRLWEHRGCSFTFQGVEHSCIRRSAYQAYESNSSADCHIKCHGINRFESCHLSEFRLIPRIHEQQYSANPYHKRKGMRRVSDTKVTLPMDVTGLN